MIKIITATQAKNLFGETIKQVYAGNDHVMVEKSGIPVVAIIPISDYEVLADSQHDVGTEIKAKIRNARRAGNSRTLLRNLARSRSASDHLKPTQS
jgi:prevent-host-death family protein